MKQFQTMATMNRDGFTLVEVILSAGILAILAVLAVTSLYYPAHLIVASGVEQAAIHAGNSEIERHLNNYNNPVPAGLFVIKGGRINVVTNEIYELFDAHSEFGGGAGDKAHYLMIATTIEYQNGGELNTVRLNTYRSLEIDSGER